jgi:phosphoribosylglycinamide formyltransferase-1
VRTRIAIFASGNGSNAEALMKRAVDLSQVEISFVLSDQPGAGVLARAEKFGVKTYVVPKEATKGAQEKKTLALLEEHKIQWIFLAGYMRLLSANFLGKFAEMTGDALRVVNIHPSLLPAYPGIDSIARAYNDCVGESGVTLHFVDEGMDTGKVIRQEKVTLGSYESLLEWQTRIHALEHQMYTDFLSSLEGK